MKSIATVLVCALALTCASVHAQGYRWVDKDGKTQYGDAPPAGVKATPMKPPAGAPIPAPATGSAAASKDSKDAKDGKDAKKAPVTPEQAFKERQLKSKEAADKSAKDQAEADTRKQNCERAQASLRNLESGQRISQTNAAGERVFLEDSERPAKIAESQKLVANWCK